jgi:hypothetical protein
MQTLNTNVKSVHNISFIHDERTDAPQKRNNGLSFPHFECNLFNKDVFIISWYSNAMLYVHTIAQ